MIVVLADDLTGAAEIAGAALSLGFSAEVQIDRFCPADCDVIVVDTHTRSMDSLPAAMRLRSIARDIVNYQPDLIYKKVDSVLRGHVAREIAALLSLTSMSRCLLVPANPRKGRLIQRGRVRVAGKPLNETEFACDPEYPSRSASVLDLLDVNPDQLSLVAPGSIDTAAKISIGDAVDCDDLLTHARAWQSEQREVLAAGGAEFFEAILKECHVDIPNRKSGRLKETPMCQYGHSPEPLLLPVEEASGAAREGMRLAPHFGQPEQFGNSHRMHELPEALLISGSSAGQAHCWGKVIVDPKSDVRKCAEQLRELLQSERYAALHTSISEPPSEPISDLPRRQLLEVTRIVLRTATPRTLWIEGGRTASELVRFEGYSRLTACKTHGDGVVEMEVQNCTAPRMIVKPGSYPWPVDSVLVNVPNATIDRNRDKGVLS